MAERKPKVIDQAWERLNAGGVLRLSEWGTKPLYYISHPALEDIHVSPKAAMEILAQPGVVCIQYRPWVWALLINIKYEVASE